MKLLFVFLIVIGSALIQGTFLPTKGLKAEQISTAARGDAWRAIDGNAYGQYHAMSCTHTRGGTSNEWWYVSLNRAYNIEMVVIYNRKDCCSYRLNGAKVFAVQNGAKKLCGIVNETYRVWGYQIQCGGVIADTIRIELDTRQPLTLCEVKIDTVDDDDLGYSRLPLNGVSARQSSTHGSGPASFAIDGRRNDHFWQRSCTHTYDGRLDNWWEMDLNGAYFIESVDIYNRRDCCGGRLNGAEVFAIANGVKTSCGSVSYRGDIYMYTIECGGVVADHIRIEQPKNELTLCEVEVFVGESGCDCNKVDTTRYDLTDVQYDIESGVIEELAPKQTAVKYHRNAGSAAQTLRWIVSRTVTETSSFTHEAGASVTVGTKFRTGVPYLADGEISVEATANYQYTNGKEKSTARTVTEEFWCTGAAHKITECRALLYRYKMSVSYERKWTNKIDSSCVCEDSGVFNSISGSKLVLNTTERDLDD